MDVSESLSCENNNSSLFSAVPDSSIMYQNKDSNLISEKKTIVFIDGATSSCSDVDMEREDNKSGDEIKNRKDREPDYDDNNIIHGYNPKLALQRAIEDWIPEFYQPKGSSNRFTAVTRQQSDASDEELSKNDINLGNLSKHSNSSSEAYSGKDDDTKPYSSDSSDTKKSKESSKKNLAEVKDSGKRKIEELEPLSNQDIQTMCDLFYLPFQHGSRGVYLLKEAHWLVQHAGRVKDCYKVPQSEQVRESFLNGDVCWFSFQR